MRVIPAVDIRGGRCVRLMQGDTQRQTVYSDDPLHMAHYWVAQGAQRLHVADLDGAFTGTLVNVQVIQQLLKTVDVPVQVGGGIRDLPSVRQLFAWGAAAVILGTLAVEQPEMVRQIAEEFGDRVMVSLDLAGGQVVTAGWTKASGRSGVGLAREVLSLGIQRLVVTDTERDGTLMGVNVEKFRSFVQMVKAPIIVAGGVASLEDLRQLKTLEPSGVVGVIVGKALYEGAFSLEAALRVAGD